MSIRNYYKIKYIFSPKNSYWNESFYAQFYHQLFFTVTEIITSGMMLNLANSKNTVKPSKLLVVLLFSSVHIFIAGYDQFINNLIFGRSKLFEGVRDIFLLLSDALFVLFCIFELNLLGRRRNLPVHRLFFREELVLSVIVGILLTLFAINI